VVADGSMTGVAMADGSETHVVGADLNGIGVF
jgi:hypothetical protein